MKRRIIFCKIISFNLQLLLAGSFCLLDISLNANDACAKKKGKNTELPSEQNFEKGVEFYKQRDFDSAIDAFLQSVYFARNGFNSEAYFWLGKSYMAKHDDQKAIDAFKKHIEQNIKQTPDAHLYLGEIYLRGDQLPEAENEAMRATIEYGLHGEKAHNLHGKILMARADYSGARMEFMHALKDAPWTYTEAWMNYAETYMKQKSWPEAYKQYNNMLTNPKKLEGLDKEKVYLKIGICVLAKGDHQGAINNFRQVLEMNPQNPDAHLQMAMVFDSENHLTSAIEEYSEFVRFSEDAKRIQTAKDRISILEHKLTVTPPPLIIQRPGLPSPVKNPAVQRPAAPVVPQVPILKDSGF